VCQHDSGKLIFQNSLAGQHIDDPYFLYDCVIAVIILFLLLNYVEQESFSVNTAHYRQ
jgi:hypothetical protein